MKVDKYLDKLKATAKQAREEERNVFAAEILRAYLKHRPRDGCAWMMYGDALTGLWQWREAWRALMRALRLAPDEYRRYVQARLGMLSASRGRWRNAEKWFALATEGGPDHDTAWIWVERGETLAEMGFFESAMACLTRGVRSEEEAASAYCAMGKCLVAEGKYEEGRKAFERGRVKGSGVFSIDRMSGSDKDSRPHYARSIMRARRRRASFFLSPRWG